MPLNSTPNPALRRLFKAWLILASIILLTPVARSQTLKKIDTFDLPGPPGKRFDYLTIDYKHSLAVDVRTHRVYTPEEQEDGRPVSRMVVYDSVVKKQ